MTEDHGAAAVTSSPNLTPSCKGKADRLLELLFSEGLNGEAAPRPQLFCELEELNDGVWCEVARWVRFEEDVEIGGGRWSKPFVAAVSLRSLFQLRQYLSTGAILLDVNVDSFSQLVNLVANTLTDAKLLDADVQPRFVETLMSRHVHQHENGCPKPRHSFNEIRKRLSVCRRAENAQEAKSESADITQSESFARKLPPGSEASSSLIGGVNYLKRSVSAFVRLSSKTTFQECSQVAIPTRFIFIVLGPLSQAKDLLEVGRAMETIMSDDMFREVAYHSKNQADVLTGLEAFFAEGMLLSPSQWNLSLRIAPPKELPSIEERRFTVLKHTLSDTDSEKNKCSEKSAASIEEPTGSNNETEESLLSAFMEKLLKKQVENENAVEAIDPELQRTGRIFGGLVADIKRKLPWLRSDITDAFNIQCVAAIFYLFFACLSPIVTFGGLLGIATDNNMAAFESILAGAVCGTTYHLLAGQPLTVITTTGPVLIFEKILSKFAKENDMDYLTLRYWIGIWAAIVFLFVVAFDLSVLVKLITRFTEECFATLVSIIFIVEAFLALHDIYKENPVSAQADMALNYTCWCDWVRTNYSNSYSLNFVGEFITATGLKLNRTSFDCRYLAVKECTTVSACREVGPGCDLRQPVPDVFFFSCLIFLGTCGLSFALQNFRTSPYFTAKLRSIVSDFAVSIGVLAMVILDYFVALPTPKLVVPKEFAPTRPDRDWLVKPFVNPVWTIFVAPFPALLLSVLLFMDQQIPAVIVNRRENKLLKGKGYHLDLFIITMQIVFCASFGLPYFVAATVPTITHVNSLRKQSETLAPGEQPRFLGVIEQRVTGFVVFVLIGCAIPLRGILQFIPMPVLYGVFMYMGLSALSTSQFYHRCLLVFMSVKCQPDDEPYLRHVKTWRVHLFTAIQLAAFVLLWVVKEIKPISILFVLMLVVMIILRKLLDYVFTQDELRWLDDILPKKPLATVARSEEQVKRKEGIKAKNRSRERHDNSSENRPLRHNICPQPSMEMVEIRGTP